MNRYGRAIGRLPQRGVALAFFVAVGLPALAWAQIDSASTSHSQGAAAATGPQTTQFASVFRDDDEAAGPIVHLVGAGSEHSDRAGHRPGDLDGPAVILAGIVEQPLDRRRFLAAR